MNLPEMFPVNSSNVSSVGYDAENELVYVSFNDASLYVYKGVSQQEFENLRDAPSVGSHLHRNFKNVYPYERIG